MRGQPQRCGAHLLRLDGEYHRFGTGQPRLYLNDGTGVYTNVTATNVPVQLVTDQQDCIFGDVDGDFDLDVLIGSRAGAIPEGGVDLEAIERSLVERAMAQSAGNKSKAARLLGLTRAQLYSRLEKYGLS